MGKAVPPVQQTPIEVEEKKDSRVVIVLKYLWMPALAVFTVVSGYHFPASLAITVALLLWSTKPNANSIYDWVEKVQQLIILYICSSSSILAQYSNLYWCMLSDSQNYPLC